MSDTAEPGRTHADVAPGDVQPEGETGSIAGYLVGLGLAALLTLVSFAVARTTLVWQPSIPTALVVLAIAQMGIHLVFFLHISSGPDATNNAMALAFGVLIVLLLIVGSIWIMGHLNANMPSMERVMQMQR